MAVPTTEFNELLLSLTATELDSATKRLAIANPVTKLNFGVVNIRNGIAKSMVKAIAFKVVTWGTNTLVGNFRFWHSSRGFDQAGTAIKYATWKMDATSEWVINADDTDVGSTSLPLAEPAQNVFKGSNGSSTYISSVSKDITEAIAMYVSVDASETPARYKESDTGNQLVFSMKYDYF